jgi:hypothetical protein
VAEAATNYSGQTTRRESRTAEPNAAMRLRPPSAGVRQVNAYSMTPLPRPFCAAASLGAGIALVLDYMDQEVIDGTTSFRGARRAADWVAKRGEPYALGFSPEDITRAVEERGYRVNDHVRVTEPARRYRPPASVWCETDDFMGIVSAERTTLGGSSGQPVDKP